MNYGIRSEAGDLRHRQIGERPGKNRGIPWKRLKSPQITSGPDQQRHLHIFAREPANEMGADETGGACDQKFHRRYLGETSRICKRKLARLNAINQGFPYMSVV
jgi:hypothetical protein